MLIVGSKIVLTRREVLAREVLLTNKKNNNIILNGYIRYPSVKNYWQIN